MNQVSLSTEKQNTMPETKLLRGGMLSVPPEFQEALKVKEGDRLEVELRNGELVFRPVAAMTRESAREELRVLLKRLKWSGPGPQPSEEEVIQEAVEVIHQLRRENAQSRTR